MPSLTSFPGTPSIGQKYAIGNVQWKYNGYAWDKEFHGHTGEQLIGSIGGTTGDIDLCYPGLTISGQTLCIDNTAHIHVAGISSDGGATFDGGVKITSVLDLGNNINFGSANGIQVGGGEPTIKFESNNKISIGDPEDGGNSTFLVVDDPQGEIVFNAGLAKRLEINSTGVSAGVTLSVGKDIVVASGQDIILAGSAGISASNIRGVNNLAFGDGTTQDTASRGPGGLKYIVTSTTFGAAPTAQGQATIVSNLGGAIDSVNIFDTDLNGNDVATIMELMAANGGVIQFQNDAGTEFMFAGVAFSDITAYNLAFSSNVLTLTNMTGFQVDTSPSLGDTMYITIIPNLSQAVTGLGGTNLWNKNLIIVPANGGITVENQTNVGQLRLQDNIGKGVTFEKGIIVGASGVTFSDGTSTSTSLRTDSYTGQIETAADKTYTIDPLVSTARTITGYFIKSGSGTVTATLKNAAATIKAASVSTTSGDQSSLGNTSVAAGATLSIITSSNSSATDVIFNVEYTS